MENKITEILIVEDNPGDIDLITEAMSELSNIHIKVARDGEEAINLLINQTDSQNQPKLIMLDINLPKKNGNEVLSIIKNTLELKNIPVIMFTSSEAEVDMMHAYNLHANAYIVKPSNITEFFDIIKRIHNFWINTVFLPENLYQNK